MAGQVNPNSLRQKIEDLLLELGGHTLSDLVAEFPKHTIGGISKSLCDLRDAHKIFVEDWVFNSTASAKRHPRPVWNHVKNCAHKQVRNKRRPLPEGNAARLKKRRIEKGGSTRIAEFMFKLVKCHPAEQVGCSTVEQGND